MKKYILVPFETNILTQEAILKAMPGNIKTKARGILNHLIKNNFSWNSKGELIINQKPIENSHIIDLIKASLYPFKNFSPVGLRDFIDSLIATNIPPSFIQRGGGLPPPGRPEISEVPRNLTRSGIKPKLSRSKKQIGRKTEKWIWHKI